ncbi:MAG: hypothetical protein HRT61_14370, partial [Ekhidna sp.]|nr:hypothetical protein [Ekhidna sp.]
MLRRLSIKQKLLFLVLLSSLFTYAFTIFYVGKSMSQKSIDDAKKLADLGALEKANGIRSDFEGYLSLSRAMAMIVQDYNEKTFDERFDLEKELLTNVLASDDDLKQVWISWEYQMIDPNWSKDYGRERHAYTRKKDGSVNEFHDTTDLKSYDPNNFYYQLRAARTSGAAEPYSFAPNIWPGLVGTSIVSPIITESLYKGQVGFDFATDRYMSMTGFDAFKGSYALVISDRGNIVAHPDQQLVNSYVDQLAFIKNQDPTVLRSKLSKGEALTFEDHDFFLNERVYVNLRQVPIGNSAMFWTVGTVVPVNEITKDADVIIRNTIAIGI